MKDSAFAEKHPWTQPWYIAEGGNIWVLVFLVLIHTLSLVGLILYPLPGWPVFLTAFLFACVGGLGTTMATTGAGAQGLQAQPGPRADPYLLRRF